MQGNAVIGGAVFANNGNVTVTASNFTNTKGVRTNKRACYLPVCLALIRLL